MLYTSGWLTVQKICKIGYIPVYANKGKISTQNDINEREFIFMARKEVQWTNGWAAGV